MITLYIKKYFPIISQDLTFLEACIENHTKANLYMDQVEFQPAQNWGATVLAADTYLPEKNATRLVSKLCGSSLISYEFLSLAASLSVVNFEQFYSDREIFKPPVLIKSGGGIHNFLYQLKSSSQESTQTRTEGSNILGKLQITWRTNLGEPGRLQTQHILGSVSAELNYAMLLID